MPDRQPPPPDQQRRPPRDRGDNRRPAAGHRGHPGPQKPRHRAEPQPVPPHLPSWPHTVSLVLRPGTATPVLAGHPWLFSGAIAHTLAGPDTVIAAGVRCCVFDQHARYLGVGYYNPDSQIAVRMMAAAVDGLEPQQLPELAEIAALRVRQAVQLRRQLGLPSADTTAFRLLNADGDLLPGCIIDRYADGAVVQLSTAGAWLWRQAVVDALHAEGLIWCCLRVPTDIHPSEGLLGGTTENHGPVPAKLTVLLAGLQFEVEPGSGQKTGLYCDQRDNHLRVAQLATGRFVVDAFCHFGGFGLQAARAGATKVLCVDASQRAVDATFAHAERNGVVVQVQCGDAIHVLRQLGDAADPAKPSLVIVDPPKYATKAAALEAALKKYQALNAVALRAVQDGGWLVSCSCSGLVEPPAFVRMLAMAAHEAGVSVQLVELRGASADHPTAPAHAEGRYLKVAILRVLSKA